MFALIFMPNLTFAASSDAAKALFKTHKCTKCHTIKAIGYEKPNAKAEVKKDKDGAAPDLSKLSENVTKEGDAQKQSEHIKLYLKKKVRHGTKKHKKRFKGEDSDLDAMIGLLLELNQEDEKK